MLFQRLFKSWKIRYDKFGVFKMFIKNVLLCLDLRIDIQNDILYA